MLPSRLSILSFGLLSLLSACASAPKKSIAHVAASPNVEREKEAIDLRSMINSVHDDALIGADAAFTVDEMQNLSYMVRFGKERCGIIDHPDRQPATVIKHCDDLYKRELIKNLGERYFAGDQMAVALKCKENQRDCAAPKQLELWMRDSHNQHIELSRQEKLPKLEEFRAGKLTKEALLSSMNLRSTQ